MNGETYEIRECERQECRLRFPVVEHERFHGDCPRCGAPTRVAHRAALAHSAASPDSPANELSLSALLDNVRSLFNVGSIFRSADGAGVEQLYLCGITATPQNRKLAKTALGAERRVKWCYDRNGVEAAERLRSRGYRLWALEGGMRAEPLFSYARQENSEPPSAPIVLVVGNELTGIDPSILSLCERVWSIPMRGIKGSLNVAIAFSIAAYWFKAPHHACLRPVS
jgi:tRNA G18 (ribose-2'-O)-methylase SpoU